MKIETMNRFPLVAWFAALLLALTGCTATPAILPGAMPVEGQAEGASLALSIDWGRQVQAVAEEVTGATVSIKVDGREPIVRSFRPAAWATESLDIAGLPGGDALVRVEAYRGPDRIGVAERGFPLVVGRRTYGFLSVALDSHGRTSILPMTPLGPLPDPKARLFIRAVTFRANGHHSLLLENRTGRPISDFADVRVSYTDPNGNSDSSQLLIGDDSMPMGWLENGATVSVQLDQEVPATFMPRTTFPTGFVQPQAGAIALVKQPMGRQDVLLDYVQWTSVFSSYEWTAVDKGLWNPEATLEPVDITGYQAVRFHVVDPGAKGPANWIGEPLGPLPTQ